MWTRRSQTSHFLALLASSTGSASSMRVRGSTAAAFSSPTVRRRSCGPLLRRTSVPPNLPSFIGGISLGGKSITQQNMSSFFGGPAEGGIPRIDRAAMTEIVDDVANGSREESGYVVIDVRGHDEVQYTGKLHEVVETLPLPYIAQGALAMEEEEFEETFGFEKPRLDETVVFTCKAGIRSQQAGQLAKMAGYSDILDYMGGSDEWFS
ncbi:hypothetical protein ACHAWF_003145 [Thalassiosira exigua]